MIADGLSTLADLLWAPLRDAEWGNFAGFWLRQLLDDRFTVALFVPLLPLLLLAPRRWLREAIVGTGLAFLFVAFGAPYALFWLLNCSGFFVLTQWYAGRVERHRLTIGPGAPEGAIAKGEQRAFALVVSVIVVWYLLTMLLRKIELPDEWNRWLFEYARWCFPFHVGDRVWTPGSPSAAEIIGTPKGQLAVQVFWNPHNIGTAYLVWRLLHYFSELRLGGIPETRRRFIDFLAYLCYAPNLIQGPIERYPRFCEQLDACHGQRRWSDWPIGLARMGWGLSKSIIATLYFLPLLRDGLRMGSESAGYFHAPHLIENYALVYGGVFLIIFHLYLEFSGYCDVSAGMARLLGYRQVENFRWCWFATSLRDFWRRWHISLSSLLRDYVYIALGGNRQRAALNLVLTFVICGVWHIPNGYMAAWGAVMGLMLAVNQWWVGLMQRLDGRRSGVFSAIRRGVRRMHPLGPIVAWLFTMHCFVFSLLIFFGGRGAGRVTWEIVRRPLLALTGAECFASPS
ncbi:MAG: hypothetical protein HRU75_03700 [Planctomycetia bacterium]|nr:MAG: hypothetical protein HRU75_03700 [Planctomycetia bacterium]